MSAEDTGANPSPPWVQRQLALLAGQQGHAWLLEGPSGLGQYALALALAQRQLCEQPHAHLACGRCPGCHAVQVRTHADLCVLMPEVLMLELGWPLEARAQDEIDSKRRKPSREIRVEAMREAIEFTQRSSARGRGKVILIYPAERMNTVTANALLKSLEEPAEGLRFILASDSGQALLPTVRSRCLHHAMHWPQTDEALDWLRAAGLAPADAQVLLRAAGGRPEEALRDLRSARDANFWRQAPTRLAQGRFAPDSAGDAAALLDLLHKLCHDLLCQQVGAAPRYFAADDLACCQGRLEALSAWSRQLLVAQRQVHHPFLAGLQLEALVEQARLALHS